MTLTDTPLGRLLNAPMRPGRVEWIGLRPGRRAPMLAVGEALLNPVEGLVGDRYQGRSGERQATLIQAEHLAAIAGFVGLERLSPDALRRNFVVSGLNLLALRGRRFQLGHAVLETTGECHPCSRMEEILGVGGYNAVRGLGGLTARVIAPGAVQIGDAVCLAETEL